MAITLLNILFILNLFYVVKSWDLSLLKISSTYYTSSISVYKNRAFLSLPRTSCFNNLTNPTLIEVPWPNDYKHGIFRKKIYPNYKQQRWEFCNELQDVVSSDVEKKKARLWVLDKGNGKCSAKIIIYNLYYNNVVHNIKLNVENEKLATIVVDGRSDEFGTKAYVGGLDGKLIVFSAKTLKFSKFILNDETITPIPTAYLAMSKVDSALYVSGLKSVNLYKVNLDDIRHLEESTLMSLQKPPNTIKATFLGEKLDTAGAMATDTKGGLIYFLTRYYAILRWDTTKPLRAEYHEVLAQSYEYYPYVSQIFNGFQDDMWALININGPDSCGLENTSNDEFSTLKSRVVKILMKGFFN